MEAFSFPSKDTANHCIGDDLVLFLDITAWEFRPEVRVTGGDFDEEEFGAVWRELNDAYLPDNEPG